MKTALSFLLVAALGAGFLAGTWYSRRGDVSAAASEARTILYYVDPMHPAYRSDKPGTAPDCGMTLQPVYSDRAAVADRRAAGVPGVIAVSSERQQLIGVRVSPVAMTATDEKLRLYGRVAADENTVHRIDVGIDGFVRELSNVTAGSEVRKDQWLATFSAPELRQPIQGYLIAVELLERAAKEVDGRGSIDIAAAGVQQNADRLLTLGMSSVQLDEIARTRQVPHAFTITAPAGGFVLARNITRGQKFGRGDELYRIADLRRVWVVADLVGADAAYVKEGSIAEVSVPGRGAPLRARVSRDLRPEFNPETQSVKLRLEVDNPGFTLRPDMYVNVDLRVALPPAIAVPVDAVVDEGLKKIVFVERAAGMFEPRQVETGWVFGGRVQILNGLGAGDRVVIDGTFLLDAETRLRTTRSTASH
jgi:membrane fusion protein, copper/silver efflux system